VIVPQAAQWAFKTSLRPGADAGNRMINDKRQNSRLAMRFTAWIRLEDGTLHGCALSDISDTGARLRVEDPDKLPDTFMLILSRNGAQKRSCKVMWRKDGELGVAFDRGRAAKKAPRTKTPTPKVEAPKLDDDI